MSYELKDKPADAKVFDTAPPTSNVPIYEGDSYPTSKSPVETKHRNYWQRAVDSFKPQEGLHAPHSPSDVAAEEKPVRYSHESLVCAVTDGL